MENHEITSSEFPWNMAGWCTEKSGNVLQDLAQLVDYFKQLEQPRQESDDAYDIAHGNLYSAIYDATKVFAFSCGATWSVDDPEIIATRGKRGYIELAIKYGELPEAEKSYAGINDDVALNQMVNDLEGLLSSESRSTRTLIHDILRKSPSRLEEVETIRQLTDKVSMGEMSWDDYRDEVSRLLKYLKDALTDETEN